MIVNYSMRFTVFADFKFPAYVIGWLTEGEFVTPEGMEGYQNQQVG